MVAKVPDDAIAHLQTQAGENWIQQRINRDDGSMINEIANLPANAASIGKNPNTLGYHFTLFVDVGIQMKTTLVFFAQIVGR